MQNFFIEILCPRRSRSIKTTNLSLNLTKVPIYSTSCPGLKKFGILPFQPCIQLKIYRNHSNISAPLNCDHSHLITVIIVFCILSLH